MCSDTYIAIARPIWLRWFLQRVLRVCALAFERAGRNKAARMPVMAMTTSISTSVNPLKKLLVEVVEGKPLKHLSSFFHLQHPLGVLASFSVGQPPSLLSSLYPPWRSPQDGLVRWWSRRRLGGLGCQAEIGGVAETRARAVAPSRA